MPDAPAYLFLGGLAGASSVLAAGAQLSGHRDLARVAKVGALGSISLSAVALVNDRGLGLLATPPGAAEPARQLDVLGAGVELVAKRQLIRRLAAFPGLHPWHAAWPNPTRPGTTGAVLRLAEFLTTGALFGRRSRPSPPCPPPRCSRPRP